MYKSFKTLIASLIAMASTLASNSVWAAWETNLTQGITDLSHDVYDLHMMALYVCIAIGVLVFGAMIWSMIFHRKSKGYKAATFHESTKAEILWTVVPVLILAVLVVPAAKALIKMEDSSNPDMTIKITGYQWKWQYEYPEEGIGFFSSLDSASREASKRGSGIDPSTVDNYLLNVDNPMVIPVGKKVRFLLTSNDVNHGWGVPDLAVKKDAIPGFINDIWVIANETGTYRGQCVELCGKGHGFMPIVVIVKEEADYKAWVSKQVASAKSTAAANDKEWSQADLNAQGEKVYQTNCVACHQAGGQGIPGVFPAITASPIATGDISAHIDTVMNGRPGTAMQAYAGQLSDADLAAVITFQRNGLGNSVGDMVQPSEIKAKR